MKKHSPWTVAVGASGGVLALDLDRFKRINGSFGHDALLHVTRSIKPFLRKHDILARLGGDEFCIVLYGAGRTDALSFATRLTDAVSSNPFIWQDRSLDLSISVGVCEWDAEREPQIADALRRTDQTLIRSKARTRSSERELGIPPFICGSTVA